MERAVPMIEGADDLVLAKEAAAKLESVIKARMPDAWCEWECSRANPLRSLCAVARVVIHRPPRSAGGRLHSRDITLEAHGVTVNDALDGLAKLLGVTE